MSSYGGLVNIVFVIGLVQLSQRIGIEEPDKLTYVRAGFAIVQALVICTLLIVKSVIKSRNDQTLFRYRPPKESMFQQEIPQRVTTTITEYDQGIIQKHLKTTLTSLLIISFLHYQWNFVQPLFIHCFLPLKNLITAPVVQVHLFGRKAEGKLERPWVPEGGIMAGGQQEHEDGDDGGQEEKEELAPEATATAVESKGARQRSREKSDGTSDEGTPLIPEDEQGGGDSDGSSGRGR